MSKPVSLTLLLGCDGLTQSRLLPETESLEAVGTVGQCLPTT